MKDVVGFSIGVNDITQEVLGLTRDAEGYDQLHPKVLKQIKRAKENADSMGLKVSVCSNIAEEPAGIVALIGLGILDISIPVVSAELVRRTVNRVDSSRAKAEVDSILKDSDSRVITGSEVRRRLGLLLE
ncbi:MAG: hypothetical protein NTU61_03110 [Candidatus Altiarchaeota archaeon]|nr:hypothetical protein [Candidatus Altiarchaeota archaeon]